MAVYLVMKNNLKRVFQNRLTYLWMMLIPLLIGLVGIFSTSVVESQICVGLIIGDENEDALLKIQSELEEMKGVVYKIADQDTIHAEQIMGTYRYVIDLNQIKETQAVLEEIKASTKQQTIITDQISATERVLAMIMTAYMVIATLYAVKYIQDKDMGTVERFCLSGAGRASYTGGYIASTAIIVAVQVSVAFVLLILAGCIQTDHPVMIGTAWILIVGVVTLYGVLHAFFCHKEMTANTMSSSLAVIFMILGGTFVAVEKMPVILQWMSLASPIRWLLELV